jgi:hypothetical protein
VGVRWVFPKVGGLRPRLGRGARALVRGLRAASPGIRILPWISGYAHRHLGRGRAWRSRTARSLARLVRASGTHGIHFDIEPPFGSFGQIPGERLARLARAFRRAAPRSLVSFAIHPLATPSFPRGLARREVSALLAIADQVVVMMYDTAIADRALFRRAVVEQVRALAALARERGRARLWMGAAAYPAHRAPRFRALHDARIENVAGTAAAFREAVQEEHARDRWAGLAVFAHYSARPEDWRALRAMGH